MRRVQGGFDLGNNALKMVLEGKRAKIPNVVREVPIPTERKRISNNEKMENTFDVILRCPHVPELHGKRFFVGKLAIGNGEHEIDPQTKKARNPLVLVPFLTALAAHAESEQDEIQVSGYAGLPMDEYLIADLKEEYRQRLNGRFQVEFVSTAGREGWKVQLHLNIEVKPEGMAVTLRQIQKNMGRWNLQTMGAIDIGAFSTDISVLDREFEPIPELCQGLQIGTASALESIRERINKEYRVNFTRHMIDEIVTKDNGKMQLGIREIDISDVIEEHFRPYSRQIAQAITEILEHPKGVSTARFFIFGGGAIAYKPYLIELQERTYSEFVWLDHDPDEVIFENAISFYLLAIM
ncbi:ParM/StbA family protein [Brevibacillus humidisoli]|uniref:ParM/StbA family protein n=1 Tax=Brevibacillus humidisoli TaxID=2895522 RepID=UPI001E417BCF|nr:ParM/StbA family protein [Brevibacillus humidisoli]UFJ41342.1 ParM/StbA family protein [Brevibacillus humidisoli]